ncbi:MAG: hypothetical protein JXN60_04735 [Lentisphaerae bacterium]|nr:hypothetical protein [Lentisphaerota bacterium]
MKSQRINIRRVCSQIIVGTVFLAYSLCLAWTLTQRVMTEFDWSMLQQICEGSAPTPFQYRILVPLLMNASDYAVQSVTGYKPDIKTLALLFTMVATLLYIAGGRMMLFAVFGRTRQIDAYSFLLCLMLPFACVLPFQRYYYISDIPAIALFCWGIFLIYREKYPAFYLVYAIATLNRETSCFLTIIFLMARWMPGQRTRTLKHCIAQGALWLAIKAALWVIYFGNITDYANIGGFCRLTVINNLRSLIQAGDTLPALVWAQLLTAFGGLWVPLILHFRNIDTQFVRRSLLVLPVYLFAMTFVGCLYEIRIFGELIPIILLGHCHLICAQDRNHEKKQTAP